MSVWPRRGVVDQTLLEGGEAARHLFISLLETRW